ncbi:hypothetical protein [Prochlorococcus sp. MIT 1223]|uniref:hypothetical protein n=1 Tax=Prochlorococcus sp. MIT 1223 TaxID=3096217 RepID=UPI002A764301|nr:hypothetical protein [Prochlorococcus sp. MIT 1223]
MTISRKDDRNLKVGNLILAIWLATVPTAITYGALSLHGINICNSLTNKLEIESKSQVKELCNKASWDTTKSYIILIGFFITLPTWLWFYLSVKKKKTSTIKEAKD